MQENPQFWRQKTRDKTDELTSTNSDMDTSEQIYISSLALLKMMKHARAGVPMEVMGLMLGEFVDDYVIRVVDVFAMPQSGTGVSVEAVDPVFQTKMIDMLKQVGRSEMVVGWYHSHPGFGCWLSLVDINTQQSFEALNNRAVAVVIDPIQSVKGKVVIDSFRTINPRTIMWGQEPRQTTSILGQLGKPSLQALSHGLNRNYYSIEINYTQDAFEKNVLSNFYKKSCVHGLIPMNHFDNVKENLREMSALKRFTSEYGQAISQAHSVPMTDRAHINIGKIDIKKSIEHSVLNLMLININQTIALMIGASVF